jgi:hypothetical protein
MTLRKDSEYAENLQRVIAGLDRLPGQIPEILSEEQNPLNLLDFHRRLLLERFSLAATLTSPAFAQLLPRIFPLRDDGSIDPEDIETLMRSHEFGLDNVAVVACIQANSSEKTTLSMRTPDTAYLGVYFITEKFSDDWAPLDAKGSFIFADQVKGIGNLAELVMSEEVSPSNYLRVIRQGIKDLDLSGQVTEAANILNNATGGKIAPGVAEQLAIQMNMVNLYLTSSRYKKLAEKHPELEPLFQKGITGLMRRYGSMNEIVDNPRMSIEWAEELGVDTILTNVFAADLAAAAVAAKEASSKDDHSGIQREIYDGTVNNQQEIIAAVHDHTRLIRLLNDGGTTVVDRRGASAKIEELREIIGRGRELKPRELFAEVETRFNASAVALARRFFAVDGVPKMLSSLEKQQLEEKLGSLQGDEFSEQVREFRYWQQMRNYFSRLVKDSVEGEYNMILNSSMPDELTSAPPAKVWSVFYDNLRYVQDKYAETAQRFNRNMSVMKRASFYSYNFLARFAHFNLEMYVDPLFLSPEARLTGTEGGRDYDRLVDWAKIKAMRVTARQAREEEHFVMPYTVTAA